MKKLFTIVTRSIFMGLVISLLTSALFGQGDYYPLNPFSESGKFYLAHFNEVGTFVISILIWIGVGLLFSWSDTFFHKDWSLLRMTLTHFIVTSLGFTSLALLAGWFPLKWQAILLFETIYVFIYILIYFINYQKMKKEIGLINQNLQQEP